jgi:hypothetical protein
MFVVQHRTAAAEDQHHALRTKVNVLAWSNMLHSCAVPHVKVKITVVKSDQLLQRRHSTNDTRPLRIALLNLLEFILGLR